MPFDMQGDIEVLERLFAQRVLDLMVRRKRRRRRWAELLRQVFEVDPLRCEKCGGGMKVVSFISTAQSEVIRRILEHLGVSTVVPRAHGPPGWAVKSERRVQRVLPWEEEDFSQAPPGWGEWEPA